MQTKRLHVGRASCRNRHHRAVDGNSIARTAKGQGAGTDNHLQEQTAPIRIMYENVPGRLRGPLPQPLVLALSDGGNYERKDPPDGPLWPYIKDKDINLCTSFNTIGRSMGLDPRYSYSTNGWLGAGGYFGDKAVANESEVRHPANVFLFSEENLWKIPGLSGHTLNDNGLYIDPPPGTRDCFATYHNTPSGNRNKGSANLVFVDGHCDMIRAEDQYDGGNYEIARPK